MLHSSSEMGTSSRTALDLGFRGSGNSCLGLVGDLNFEVRDQDFEFSIWG